MNKSESLKKSFPILGTILLHGMLILMAIMMLKSCDDHQDPVMQYQSLSLAALGDFEPGEGEYVDLAAESAPFSPSEAFQSEINTQTESEVTTQKVDNPKDVEEEARKNAEAEAEKKKKEEEESKKSKINGLFGKNNNGKGGSSGDTPGGGGNEGNPNGNINGKGEFGGKGGNGQWNLKGRGLAKAPELDKKPDYEGTIYVSITVDNQGNVLSAIADPIKSKVSGDGFNQLKGLAEKAAKAAKFSIDPEAKKQVGSILITFKLK
jgi:outer membrane biosynthesis protein TonB